MESLKIIRRISCMRTRIRSLAALAGVVAGLLAFALFGGSLASAAPQTIEATLCGLKITLDQETGSILELNYPGPGRILQTIPERSSLVDLAYPITEFEPLRLATRFSRGARIEKGEGQ